ncbi:DoxX family protein [Litoreibacter roseus]|uniref:DoxX family protein n=1 Tax=Litoreibacter roseus TaxID=2601869 RepID=A0A6N6JFT1_9RHOB|nr:DoxX family protein [Litoreibacter roseus]GFE65213.1 hypothetical protein KIN_22870 [Litoreibacter roseus]
MTATQYPIPFRLLRMILSAAFLYFGLEKLLGAPSAVALYETLGFGQWPRFVTGTVETASAIGLWLPHLQAISALALTATMIIGLSALILFAGPPYWHMIALGTGAALTAFAYRHQVTAWLDSRRPQA